MKTLKQKFIAGILLIVITNIIAVGGVIYNRTGEPVSTVTLSERELSMPYSWHGNSPSDSENTGLSLNIDFKRSQYLEDLNFTKSQIMELGFNLGNKDVSFWTNSQTFYWALEYDGEHFASDIAKLENKLLEANKNLIEANQTDSEKSIKSAQREVDNLKERLDRLQQTQSRLYVIDFGRDLEPLMNKFTSQTNIIFMQGLVKPYKRNELYAKLTSQEYREAAINDKPQVLKYGLRFSNLLIGSVHIPLSLSAPLQNLPSIKYNEIHQARYEVDLSVGRRLEPVILSVSRK